MYGRQPVSGLCKARCIPERAFHFGLSSGDAAGCIFFFVAGKEKAASLPVGLLLRRTL